MRYSKQQINSLNLPDEIRSNLLSAEIPEREILLLKFSPAPQEIPGEPELIKIGVENDVRALCISKETGRALLFDPADRSSRFVNSSVKKLLECLARYECIQKTRDKIAGDEEFVEEEVNKKLVSQFEKDLYEIDRELERAEYFWPLIIEQMEHQFL